MSNLYDQATEAGGGDIQGHQQGRSNIKWGKIVEMNPEECKVRIEVEEQEGLVTYWLQMTYPKTLHDKYYWMPDIDEPRYFVNDEAGEEAPALGAFYTPEVPPNEPDVDKTEILWRDCSYVKYHRSDHRMEIYVRGEFEMWARDMVINAESLTINAGNLTVNSQSFTVNSGSIELNSGSAVTINGDEVVVVSRDALDNTGDFMVASGQSGGGGGAPDVVIEEPCWDGETEILGDLLNLQTKAEG